MDCTKYAWQGWTFYPQFSEVGFGNFVDGSGNSNK